MSYATCKTCQERYHVHQTELGLGVKYLKGYCRDCAPLNGYNNCDCCGDIIIDRKLCDICKACECSSDTPECREILVSGHHGIYVPKVFIELFSDIFKGIDDEDKAVILDGPSAETYWEAWDNVLDTAVHEDRKRGRLYRLEQDGDLFSVCYGVNVTFKGDKP